MFTGIVEEVGKVTSTESGKLTISASDTLKGMEIGGSMAVNGVCLTITRLDTKQFTVDIMPETLERTNIGRLTAGDGVNLERPLALGGRLGGHLVEGHVDATGKVFSITSDKNKYTYLTPWLALNEKNYEKYQRLGMYAKRKKILEKILTGNIISMSKGFGYTVPVPIEANITEIKEIQTSLKGNTMLGFLGTFSVNFEIPDYWGIGKSVSRGFGTVKRVEQEKINDPKG